MVEYGSKLTKQISVIALMQYVHCITGRRSVSVTAIKEGLAFASPSIRELHCVGELSYILYIKVIWIVDADICIAVNVLHESKVRYHQLP